MELKDWMIWLLNTSNNFCWLGIGHVDFNKTEFPNELQDKLFELSADY